MKQESDARLVTVAIHTYEKAVELSSLLESEGVGVTLQNVNLDRPTVSSGVRVRISEEDLPLALRIIENHEIFIPEDYEPKDQTAHNILVPVDFSANSVDIIKIAAAIACRHKTGLILLNSFIDPYISGESVQLTDSLTYDIIDADARRQIEVAAKNKMNDFADRIRSMMKSGELSIAKITTDVVEGVPEDAIVAYAKAKGPMLIVMGTRGSDQKEKDMIGSVSAEVLDSSRYPVMTIPVTPALGSVSSISQILFFCNADQDDILAMDTLLRLFPDAKSSVTLAVVPSRRRWIIKTRPQSAAKALTDYFKNKYKDFKFESVSVDTNRAIEDIAGLHELHKYNLIVVPNKKKLNVLGRIFHPSLAHRLIFNADIPMLVIPV